MNKAFTFIGKILLRILVFLLISGVINLLELGSGGLIFILFLWAILEFLSGKSQKKKRYKRLKINLDTWKEDFEKILRKENWAEEQIPDVLQFAQNFKAFEKKKFEGMKKSGFDGSIDEFNSNWEKVFADRMNMGILAVEMKPKTLRFLASLRRNCGK